MTYPIFDLGGYLLLPPGGMSYQAEVTMPLPSQQVTLVYTFDLSQVVHAVTAGPRRGTN